MGLIQTKYIEALTNILNVINFSAIDFDSPASNSVSREVTKVVFSAAIT